MSRKLYHGVSWYPELWGREIWEQDIAMMKKTGINVVRMGEFAWAVFEPEEDQTDFSLYIEAVNLLHANGIDTVMCTPTVTPPVWISHGHPERMHQEPDGRVMGHGSRQHACTNHPYFRERSAKIVEAQAQALGRLPGVIAWQIDNEFKSHVAECFCGTCRGLWHRWLEERYGTIGRLNEAWGTAVWSQTCQTFEQIPQPSTAVPFLHSSSLTTMHQLFSMELVAEFSDMQASLIRKHSPHPVTHNSSVAFHLDNERLFCKLDFAAYDTYASFPNRNAYLINCDLWRNVKKNRGFWVMETSPGHGGSLRGQPQLHPDGYLKAEAVAAYALGAEAFCYWLWRQQRSGCEQPHGAILSAWGKPSIGYRNVLEVEEARRTLEPVLLGTRPIQAEVAMTYSDRAKAFLRTEPHRKLQHRSLITHYYEQLLGLGLHRDLVPEGAPLDGYRLYATPYLPYLSKELTDKAVALVQQGAVWIVGPLTGGRTEEHTIPTDAALGRYLEELAGVETLYTYPMDGSGTTGTAFGMTAPLSLWSAVFHPVSAKAIGLIDQGPAQGEAFLTERHVGRGKIVMLGSLPSGEMGDAMLRQILLHYAGEAGVTLRTDVSPGTIVAPREGDGYRVWVVVNMDGQGGSVTLPQGCRDGLTGEAVAAGRLFLPPFGYRVIRMELAAES